MTVVVRLGPVPRWWMWRPGADPGPAARAARARSRRRRALVLLPAAVPLAAVLLVLLPGPWAVLPFVLVGAILLLPRPVDGWDVALAARERDVVHCAQFPDEEQRRRARRLCEHFLALRGNADPARLAHVEALLWQALTALRGSLAVRGELAGADNRPGLAAAIAESTRELAALDRRVDRFAAALRIAVEESDPGPAASALRRVAALDPI
ncbi:hypothetical protein ABZ816_06855 [Actinosynnema sp. NPDC047251]|uniref:Uncharacterized protein n=1 Tax=Saccharothrix espanaensis (strain ATCC 51144 / DSM 44229 / JCM 9112 / NBRC 15066 / NRRL 15764) TaxID=1179773 RepID=K0JSJ6_SACES|nr:hypothetical protein [Saccharothrix espanaensis]CCH27824.1 hypothetical protein BN6_04930 [Saccharothrix espanaensis DSM 44229]